MKQSIQKFWRAYQHIGRHPAAKSVIWILAALLLLALFFLPGEGPQAKLQHFIELYSAQNRGLRLLEGLGSTLALTGIALCVGLVIGLILALIRVAYQAGAPIGILNALAELYVAVVRGTPVALQLMIIYFGLFAQLPVNKIFAAGLAFGINSGAYVAEIFRAGIESVDPGQMEASRSLGLSYFASMRLVVLPQAIKHVLPTLLNEAIALLKETAVAGYIAVTDLTRVANNIRTKTFDMSPLYLSALMYLGIVLLMTKALHHMEGKLKQGDRAQASL